jgi:hypothetical protein
MLPGQRSDRLLANVCIRYKPSCPLPNVAEAPYDLPSFAGRSAVGRCYHESADCDQIFDVGHTRCMPGCCGDFSTLFP